jgi:tRNA G37 N-methylase TrmD
MSGIEGAEREDHDEREAGVRVLDCGCSVGDVILNSGEAAARTVREPKV